MAGFICKPTLEPGRTCAEGHPQRCTCCENITTVLKEWLSPNEPCSFMRALLQPIFESEFYLDYFRRCKYKRVIMLIALFSIGIYGWSMNQGSWRCELEECLSGVCTERYKSLLLYLYVRGVVLNVNGLIFSVGLLYGTMSDKPDFIYLWLLWKEIVVMIGLFTVGLLGIMSFYIEENIRLVIVFEILHIIANIITWIFAFGYYEQVCPCLVAAGGEEEGGEEGGDDCGGEVCEDEAGGGMDDEDVDGDGYLKGEFIIPGNRLMQNYIQQPALMSNNSMPNMAMMGSVLPASLVGGPYHAGGTTMYAAPQQQMQPPNTQQQQARLQQLHQQQQQQHRQQQMYLHQAQQQHAQQQQQQQAQQQRRQQQQQQLSSSITSSAPPSTAHRQEFSEYRVPQSQQVYNIDDMVSSPNFSNN